MAVYPRVGGGTPTLPNPHSQLDGLSPRGRGNLVSRRFPVLGGGSIPAWAGEPKRRCPMALPSGVYPRVGGGTCSGLASPASMGGLSPRGRGNRPWEVRRRDSLGSIPAWAGEPTYTAAGLYVDQVYPRVGGGTGHLGPDCRRHQGLSPRGRGNRIQRQEATHSRGSIPAWAGEPG